MVECVLFDLDGVLVDACDWHYEALNASLISFGYNAISKEDHEIKYNGLPTKIKLEMLGIDKNIAEQINNKKQKHTLEIIDANASFMQDKIELHQYLKSKNIKIGCVTNSIRKTALKMLEATGQLSYMDIVVANEDVVKNKPHPDCYNYAIRKLKVNPLNVLCVEDSDKGIQSALGSFAGHLFTVETTFDVNMHTIGNQIEDINSENIDTHGR